MSGTPAEPTSPLPNPSNPAVPAIEATQTPIPEPAFVPLAMDALKMPEGFQVSDEHSKNFLEIVNGAKLPAEAAQKMVDFQAKYLTDAEAAAQAQWDDVQKQWKEQIKALPDIGGNNLAATEAAVAKVLDKYGTPELRQMLDITGAGNHPEMVKFVHKLSTLFNEASPVPGDPSPGAQKSRVERMYPQTA